MQQGPPGSSAAATPDQDVQSVVDSVFRDPELARGLRPPSKVGTAEQLVEWFQSVFMEWTDWLARLRVESPGLYLLLFLVLLATLVLLVWHIVYTMRRVFRAPAGEGVARIDGESGVRARHSSQLRAQARELAGQGQFREAARHLLLALLALLEERRIVHVAGGWTNREILGRVAARCGGSAALETFGSTLERSSYGGVEPGAAEFHHLDGIFDDLRGGLHPGAAQPPGRGPGEPA